MAEAIVAYINDCGGTYARASYGRVARSTATVEECRDLLAETIGVSKAEHIFFTMNATQGANTLLKGLRLKDCRVLVSPLEHNAVMRPLQFLADNFGVNIELLPADRSGKINVEQLSDIDKTNVGLIVVNHRSNVNGTIQPIEQIAAWADQIPVMLDATQSIGYCDLSIDRWNIDYMIFTAHKGLLGPTGVGGFYAKNPDNVDVYTHGGTGSRSDSFLMPDLYPDRFEAGTPNMAGIVGLLGAMRNRPQAQHTFDDFCKCIARLQKIEGITIHASQTPDNPHAQAELFSITHSAIGPSQLCASIYDGFGCEVRQGLHCAPLAHRTIGTYPHGTVRISLSPYHTVEDIAYLCSSIETICRS